MTVTAPVNETVEIMERIREHKARMGRRMVILGHHYQREEIVALADVRGDSYELSLKAAQAGDAEYIIFCGVHFMAETAATLARPDQVVIHPEFHAGCPMADMANLDQVENCWEEIESVLGADAATPVTYMNSWATLKAFCGAHGGAVCTSSNADKVFRWAFEKRGRIFFYPDEHLGRNTALDMGLAESDLVVWDPKRPMGGLAPEQIRPAKVILWKGYCHVHTWFKPEHIEAVRSAHPEVKVVVHPECTRDTVLAADAHGSTAFICRYVAEAGPGSTVAIGTEINMIGRLAREYPDRKVMALSRSLCPNMYKINLHNVLYALEDLGRRGVVTLPPEVKADARLALDRMLALAPGYRCAT